MRQPKKEAIELDGQQLRTLNTNQCKRLVVNPITITTNSRRTINVLLPTLTVYGVVGGWPPFQVDSRCIQQSRLDVLRG